MMNFLVKILCGNFKTWRHLNVARRNKEGIKISRFIVNENFYDSLPNLSLFPITIQSFRVSLSLVALFPEMVNKPKKVYFILSLLFYFL